MLVSTWILNTDNIKLNKFNFCEVVYAIDSKQMQLGLNHYSLGLL